MKRVFISQYFLIFFAALYVFVSNSCKQPEPPKGLIKVVVDTTSSTSGTAVSGATILVSTRGAKGPGIIKKTLITNSAGEAEISVELDAVLNLYAYKVTGFPAPKDSIKATGALKLEKDKGNTVDEITLKLRY